MGIRVRAVLPEGKIGWYGDRQIRNGQIFEIQSMEHFSDARRTHNKEGKPVPPGWMELVDPPKAAAAAAESKDVLAGELKKARSETDAGATPKGKS